MIQELYYTNTREYTNIPSCWGKLVFDSSRLQEGIFVCTLVKLYNKANFIRGQGYFMQTKYLCVLIQIWIKGEVGADKPV